MTGYAGPEVHPCLSPETGYEEIFASEQPTQKTFWAGIWKTRID